MELIPFVGWLAATVAILRFAPQAWKVIRSRQTDDLSTATYVLFTISYALWLTYGILRLDWPIMAANGVCLVLGAFILVMKLLPDPKTEAVAEALDPTSKP
jgi:MtN3 and saliva related transmembrane protein